MNGTKKKGQRLFILLVDQHAVLRHLIFWVVNVNFIWVDMGALAVKLTAERGGQPSLRSAKMVVLGQQEEQADPAKPGAVLSRV